MSDPRPLLGLRGEEAAAATLEAAGCTVLARRWRSRAGELDLVALDGTTVVFVEVKTRSGAGYGAPAEAVTARKRARLARAASAFLQQRRLGEHPCRFDVVEVTAGPGDALRCRHLADAFRLTGKSGRC